MGDYESLRLDVGFSGDIGDDEDLSEAYGQAFDFVNEALSDELDAQLDAMKKDK